MYNIYYNTFFKVYIYIYSIYYKLMIIVLDRLFKFIFSIYEIKLLNIHYELMSKESI